MSKSIVGASGRSVQVEILVYISCECLHILLIVELVRNKGIFNESFCLRYCALYRAEM